MNEEIWYTLTGAINPDLAQAFINWINSQIYNTSVKRLKLIMSSVGGDIDSAIRIYSYLKSVPMEVETIGFSQIDSAANIVFLAGTKRTSTKDCRFFMHEGTFTIGNPTSSLHTLEETLMILKELSKRHVAIISTETGKSKADIEKALSDGIILPSEKAREFGIVHEVVEKLPLTRQTPIISQTMPTIINQGKN